MPLSVQEIFDLPYYSSPARFALEPARSAIESLLLLTSQKELPGVSDWVTSTILAMSKAERETNDLVLLGLHYVVVPTESWNSFPAYLDHLSGMPAEKMRDKMLAVYERMPRAFGAQAFGAGEPVFDLQSALSSPEQYLAYLRQRFMPNHINEALERQAYQYVTDPPAMKRMVLDHLNRMWQAYLSPEWERNRPILQEAVRAFEQLNLKGKSLPEITRLVLGQDIGEDRCEVLLANAKRLVFVPHPHVGPYMPKSYQGNDEMIVFFGVRLPQGVMIDAPDLSRADIVVRLSALADDNRLRILRYIAENGEQRSQEVIEALALSQSAASRHLTQLSASGYLTERRCDGGKCYALNPERIVDTLQAIRNFLLVDERNLI